MSEYKPRALSLEDIPHRNKAVQDFIEEMKAKYARQTTADRLAEAPAITPTTPVLERPVQQLARAVDLAYKNPPLVDAIALVRTYLLQKRKLVNKHDPETGIRVRWAIALVKSTADTPRGTLITEELLQQLEDSNRI